MSDDIRFPEGTYRARAVSAVLCFSKDGKEQLAVEFDLLDEGYVGQRITRYEFFYGADAEKEAKNQKRAIATLETAGWTGTDLSDVKTGLGSTDVELVIKTETYNGKSSSKVAFVNRPGAMSIQAPMSPEQAKAFAARMKGVVLAARQGKPGNGPGAPMLGHDGKPLPF